MSDIPALFQIFRTMGVAGKQAVISCGLCQGRSAEVVDDMTPALQPQTIGVFGSAGPLTGPGNADLVAGGDTESGFDLLMEELAFQLVDAQLSANTAIPPPTGLAVPAPTEISQTDVNPQQPALEFAVPLSGQTEPSPLVKYSVAPTEPNILVAPLPGTDIRAELPSLNGPAPATVSSPVPDADDRRSAVVEPDVAKASPTGNSPQLVTGRDAGQPAFIFVPTPIAGSGQAQGPAWPNASAVTGSHGGPKVANSALVSNTLPATNDTPKAFETIQAGIIPVLAAPSEPAFPKSTGPSVEPQSGSSTSLAPTAAGVTGRPAEGLRLARSMNPAVEPAGMTVPERPAGVASAEMAWRQRLGETPAARSDLGTEFDGGAPVSGTPGGAVAAPVALQTAHHHLIAKDAAEPPRAASSEGSVHSTETPAPASAAASELQTSAAAIAGEMKALPTSGDTNPLVMMSGPNAMPSNAPGVMPQLAAMSLHQPVPIDTLAPVIVDLARSGEDGATHLALSPEELGRMTITIRQDVDGLKVSLMAERPETLDLMRRHAAELTADLRQAGFAGASLHFGQSGQDPSPHQGRAGPDLPEAILPEPLQSTSKLADLLHPPASGRAAGVGLDIRF